MQVDAHGPDYPRLGSATSETSADLRDIEEPCTTALALDPTRILPGDCADAWRSVRSPHLWDYRLVANGFHEHPRVAMTNSVPNSGRDSTRPPGPATDRYRDRSPELVKDHDFRSEAKGLAIPYGIYDPRANAGTVFVGQTADTPAFAVDCIEKWWRTEGCKHYPEAKALQILADGGGSNSSTARAWKYNLQHRLCNRHGLRVTVAHYPPATSKWNPIEHRLFCEVSKNWAGRPLDSYETILKYLRTTRTATGLRVRAHLARKTYKTGIKVTDAQMQELRITPNSSLPKWNYTIEPM